MRFGQRVNEHLALVSHMSQQLDFHSQGCRQFSYGVSSSKTLVQLFIANFCSWNVSHKPSIIEKIVINLHDINTRVCIFKLMAKHDQRRVCYRIILIRRSQLSSTIGLILHTRIAWHSDWGKHLDQGKVYRYRVQQPSITANSFGLSVLLSQQCYWPLGFYNLSKRYKQKMTPLTYMSSHQITQGLVVLKISPSVNGLGLKRENPSFFQGCLLASLQMSHRTCVWKRMYLL